MPYGILKVDTITFTNGGVDQSITVSGIVASTSGNLTVTGTISGDVVRGGTTVSGATVTGAVGQFGSLTAVSGVFTTQISGATVTGNVGRFTSVTGGTAGFTTVTGSTVTGNIAQFTTLTGGTAGFTTVTGSTVTGTTANFTSGNFTSISGGTHTITSGVFASGTVTNPSISFVGDADTGIYASAANQVSVTTSGTERLRVDAAGQIEAVSLGSESAPVYSFTTDPNTGIYSPGADQVAISTNGTGRLFVNASGNIGVGLTPSAWGASWQVIQGIGGSLGSNTAAGLFSINNAYSDGSNWRYANNGVATSYFQLSGEHIWNRAATGTAGNALTWLESMRLDSSGRLGLGTSSPTAKFESYFSSTNPSLSSNTGAGLSVNGTSNVRLNFGNYPGSPYSSWVQSSDGSGTAYPLVLNPLGGAVGIGTTSPGYALEVASTVNYQGYFVNNTSGTGVLIGGISGAGTITSQSTATPLVFARGGIEAARIDASSRLLVGTSSTSASTRFVIQGNSAGSGSAAVQHLCFDGATPASGDGLGFLIFGDNAQSQGAWITARRDGGTWSASSKPSRLEFSTTADGASSPTERMRIDSAGNVGIGTTPSAWGGGGGPRGVNIGATGILFNINSGSFFGDNWYFNGTGDIRIGAGYASRYICSSSGRCATATGATSTAGSTITWVDGPYVANGGTSWTNSSDERLKTITGEIESGLDKVSQLRAAKFYWKSDVTQAPQIGLIAQDLLNVLPEVVVAPTEEDISNGEKEYLGVNYDQVIPLLVAALKESKERIETLEAKVAALEGQ